MEQFNQNQKNEAASIGLNEIRENFINDFIQEILETLDSIELELVNLEVDPDNADYLNEVYCNFHTIKGLAGFLEEGIASRITEDTEALLSTCQKFNIATTRNIINVLLQTILFLRKICNNVNLVDDVRFQGEIEQHLISIKQLGDEIMMDVKQPIRSAENRIGEILMQDGAIEQQDVDYVLEKQSNIYQRLKFGEIAIREKKVDAGELIKAIRAQKIRNESNQQYVKIPIKRLDQILNIINQLENIQNKLHHESVLRFGSNDAYTSDTKRAEDMSADIRKILCELRLVTLQRSFQKLTRAVRAMIEEKGLHVVFSTIGEVTELNKEVAEDIIIPLAEIIELMLVNFSSEKEKRNNKMGSIEVVAYKHDETVIIEISNNDNDCYTALSGSKKIEEIQSRIEKIKGRTVVEMMDEDGCKVKIILQS